MTPRADGLENGDQTPLLTDDHMERIVEAKLQGASDKAVAEQLDVSRAVVQRFTQRPEFKAAINTAHADLLTNASRRLASAASVATGTLLRAMTTDDVPWSVKVRAAQTVFRSLGVERMAAAVDNHGDAQVESARATLAAKLDQMTPAVIDVTPLRAVVDEPDEAKKA
jgi:hypothetical protein